MRFYDLILGKQEWDLKDEFENKEVISKTEYYRAK